MKIIKVNDFIQSSFSNEQANILKKCIESALKEKQDKIVLDFEGITRYTTLFFNFSTGYFLKLLGRERYDSIFELRNLSTLGESTYLHSYNNSLKAEYDSDKVREAINNILLNSNEE